MKYINLFFWTTIITCNANTDIFYTEETPSDDNETLEFTLPIASEEYNVGLFQAHYKYENQQFTLDITPNSNVHIDYQSKKIDIYDYYTNDLTGHAELHHFQATPPMFEGDAISVVIGVFTDLQTGRQTATPPIIQPASDNHSLLNNDILLVPDQSGLYFRTATEEERSTYRSFFPIEPSTSPSDSIGFYFSDSISTNQPAPDNKEKEKNIFLLSLEDIKQLSNLYKSYGPTPMAISSEEVQRRNRNDSFATFMMKSYMNNITTYNQMVNESLRRRGGFIDEVNARSSNKVREAMNDLGAYGLKIQNNQKQVDEALHHMFMEDDPYQKKEEDFTRQNQQDLIGQLNELQKSEPGKRSIYSKKLETEVSFDVKDQGDQDAYKVYLQSLHLKSKETTRGVKYQEFDFASGLIEVRQTHKIRLDRNSLDNLVLLSLAINEQQEEPFLKYLGQLFANKDFFNGFVYSAIGSLPIPKLFSALINEYYLKYDKTESFSLGTSVGSVFSLSLGVAAFKGAKLAKIFLGDKIGKLVGAGLVTNSTFQLYHQFQEPNSFIHNIWDRIVTPVQDLYYGSDPEYLYSDVYDSLDIFETMLDGKSVPEINQVLQGAKIMKHEIVRDRKGNPVGLLGEIANGRNLFTNDTYWQLGPELFPLNQVTKITTYERNVNELMASDFKMIDLKNNAVFMEQDEKGTFRAIVLSRNSDDSEPGLMNKRWIKK